ncbi:hypothetical protein [Algoriphagus marinus]|jgi:hypothetical protein|uniref:hypothetical protein n=1 Tax=Algoriphagus marinus TaxID=1925762 RepID=UPI00094B7FF4|nr:hypothetical protein [Algoriphagus marinus]
MVTKQLNFRKGVLFASLVIITSLTWTGANFAAQPQAEFLETNVASENDGSELEGGPGKSCTVSHIPEQNKGGCQANPYGGSMCVRSGSGPSCNGAK